MLSLLYHTSLSPFVEVAVAGLGSASSLERKGLQILRSWVHSYAVLAIVHFLPIRLHGLEEGISTTVLLPFLWQPVWKRVWLLWGISEVWPLAGCSVSRVLDPAP